MRRYLWQGNFNNLPQDICDVVIIGTGLAGIYTALHLDPSLDVILINKNGLAESNSMYAQGGIAAAVAANDSPALHFEDSLIAGAGLNDPAALEVLVSEGPDNIQLLREWGVPFDLDAEGKLVVSREGAHTRDRIVHCHGDATGFHVTSCLAGRLSQLGNCKILNRTCLVDFLTDARGKVIGILTLSTDHADEFRLILARQVILATGGIGGLFPRTTNAAAATGDGLAAAMRCGAEVKDLEFIQFHPTALPKPDAQGRCFLISEAVRGEGAILRNHKGKAFMAQEHPQADLAPRDVVSRAIYRQMLQAGTDHVWLDITHRNRAFLQKRFPMIYETCAKLKLDMATQWLPVAPVQHYYMGGVATDLDGRTSRPGLWAVGEAACTGIYGANRLASNSLLECLVFGRRIARAINADSANGAGKAGKTGKSGMAGMAKSARAARSASHVNLPINIGQLRILRPANDLPASRIQAIRQQIRQLMDRYCGILRDQEGLETARDELGDLNKELAAINVHDCLTMETCQMAIAARAIIDAALERKNSIGAHFRTDDPAGKLDSVI